MPKVDRGAPGDCPEASLLVGDDLGLVKCARRVLPGLRIAAILALLTVVDDGLR